MARGARALLEKEKAATRARDALAAERRRLPMTQFAPATSSTDRTGGSSSSTCSRAGGS